MQGPVHKRWRPRSGAEAPEQWSCGMFEMGEQVHSRLCCIFSSHRSLATRACTGRNTGQRRSQCASHCHPWPLWRKEARRELDFCLGVGCDEVSSTAAPHDGAGGRAAQTAGRSEKPPEGGGDVKNSPPASRTPAGEGLFLSSSCQRALPAQWPLVLRSGCSVDFSPGLDPSRTRCSLLRTGARHGPCLQWRKHPQDEHISPSLAFTGLPRTLKDVLIPAPCGGMNHTAHVSSRLLCGDGLPYQRYMLGNRPKDFKGFLIGRIGMISRKRRNSRAPYIDGVFGAGYFWQH